MQIDQQQAQLITEGWVKKQSRWLKAWRKRYAFLYDTTLYISLSRESPKPRHVLDLLEFVHVKPADEVIKKKNSFMIGLKSGEKYFFSTTSEEERNFWVQRIETILRDPPKRMTGEQLKDKPLMIGDNLQFYLASDPDRKIEIVDATAQQKIILRSTEYRNSQFKVASSTPGFVLISVRKNDGTLAFLGPDGMFDNNSGNA